LPPPQNIFSSYLNIYRRRIDNHMTHVKMQVTQNRIWYRIPNNSLHLTRRRPSNGAAVQTSVYQHSHLTKHDAFAAVNAATIASKMTIAAVKQACHRRR